MFDTKTVFVLAPHCDDAEFGCGGTIAKLVEEGADVYSLVFTKSEERVEESLKAGAILGIKKSLSFGLPIREIESHRQVVLDKLVELKERYEPDLVLQPSMEDLHQDHKTVAQEGLRAFKDTNVWAYEVLWNNFNFPTHLFVSLTDTHIQKKLKAIQCYKSQSHKRYADPAYTIGLLKVRGVQAGVDNAEVFSVLRMIV